MTGAAASGPDHAATAAGGVILCADDFALAPGVSRGIAELAAARRLSATGAIVTLPGWVRQGADLIALKPLIAIGLHLNLTLGRPLGAMPKLAPDAVLPNIGRLIAASLSGRIDSQEIAAEVGRQLAAFKDATGVEAEFVDGHQHAHALPGIRAGLVSALVERYGSSAAKPLVRDPGDHLATILQRGTAIVKSLALNRLSAGFRNLVHGAGFQTNDTFSGVSAFNPGKPYGKELAAFMLSQGDCHIVMCHPGYPDQELAALDPVVQRRRQELDTLLAWPGLPDLIWHPVRDDTHAAPRWPQGAPSR